MRRGVFATDFADFDSTDEGRVVSTALATTAAGWLQLLAGMKRHAETSEFIDLDTALDATAVTAVAVQ